MELHCRITAQQIAFSSASGSLYAHQQIIRPDLQKGNLSIRSSSGPPNDPLTSVVIAESSSAERYWHELDALGFSRQGLTRLGPSRFLISHGFHLSYFKQSTFS